MLRHFIKTGSFATVLLMSATAAQARFLQADPVGNKDDLNLYTYVGNDPADRTDPMGLFAVDSSNCSTTECTQAANNLTAVNNKYTSKVNGLKDDQKIKLKNGKSMTGGQIKSLWNKSTISLTDKTADFGNSGTGANSPTNVDSEGNVMSFLLVMNGHAAYQATTSANVPGGDNLGALSLVFHEIGHNAPGADDYQTQLHQSFAAGLTSSGLPFREWNKGDSEWRDNERNANANAAAMMRNLNIPFVDFNGYGQ
jgi:uncharacterized protein RhaS with RHS repeats